MQRRCTYQTQRSSYFLEKNITIFAAPVFQAPIFSRDMNLSCKDVCLGFPCGAASGSAGHSFFLYCNMVRVILFLQVMVHNCVILLFNMVLLHLFYNLLIRLSQ